MTSQKKPLHTLYVQYYCPTFYVYFKEYIKECDLNWKYSLWGFIRWDHTGVGRALNSVWLVSLPKGEIWTDTYIGRTPMWRRWERLGCCFYWYKPRITKDYQPSPKAKGETGTEEITPAENWIQDFGLQNCDTVNFCCLSHLVYSSLLRQP